VSNRILLFSQENNDDDILLHESILKAILRKMRKTAYYSRSPYLWISENGNARKDEEISKYDGIIGGKGVLRKEKAESLFDAIKPYAHFHFCGKKCVVSPYLAESSLEENGKICDSRILLRENALKTAEEILSLLEKRIATVVVCDSGRGGIEKELISVSEKLFARKENITLERKSPEEIMWQYKNIESFPDVVLTAENEALVTAFMCGLRKSFGGYVKCIGENGNVYLSEKLPFSEFTNSKALCFAMTCAAMLENELLMPSAANRLRRAAALAWEKCAADSEKEFMQTLFHYINENIRQRGTTDDC